MERQVSAWRRLSAAPVLERCPTHRIQRGISPEGGKSRPEVSTSGPCVLHLQARRATHFLRVHVPPFGLEYSLLRNRLLTQPAFHVSPSGRLRLARTDGVRYRFPDFRPDSLTNCIDPPFQHRHAHYILCVAPHRSILLLSHRIGQGGRNPHPLPFSLAAREKGAEGGLRDVSLIQENRGEHEWSLEAGVEILGIVLAVESRGFSVFPAFSS
jgi:hypothetical protein